MIYEDYIIYLLYDGGDNMKMYYFKKNYIFFENIVEGKFVFFCENIFLYFLNFML